MEQCEAMRLINEHLTYKDGYSFKAVDFSERHGGSLLVRLLYTSYDYAQEFAPNYSEYDAIVVPYFFVIVPAHYGDMYELMREVLRHCLMLDEHENREAFRYFDGEKWQGVFNPHLPDGQMRFGQPMEDIRFNDIALDGPTLAKYFGNEKTR